MDAGREGRGYEEVRARLRERGYLQGPIERFVLAEALGGRAASVAIAAAKAALLGAPLLGGLLAAVAVAVNRPLLGATDALLLWVYSAAAAFVLLFLLDALSAAVSMAVARRTGGAGRDGVRAAAMVAIPVLGYVALLWWARRPGFGTAGDALFLAAAVAVTGVVASLARLVSLAAVLRRTGDLPARSRRGIGLLVILSTAVALAFLGLPRTPVGGAGGAPPAAFEPAPDGARTVLLGIDGLDGDLLEALGAGGAADDLLAVLMAGTVVPVARPAAGSPPAVWTTLMTGARPRVHGVTGLETSRLPGVSTPLRPGAGPVPLGAVLRFLWPTRTVPVSGEARGVRTVWEIVGLRRPVAAVGWWASWPAERPEAGGYVVSDRVLAKLLSGADPVLDTDPESLFARLREDFEGDLGVIRVRFESAFDGVGASTVRELAWDSFLIDAHALEVLERLLRDPEVRFGAAYLPGLDILRRRVAEVAAGSGAVRDLVAGPEVLAAYVAWLGERVRAFGDPAGRRLVVVGDPGRSATEDSEGFVAVVGPDAATGCVEPHAVPPEAVAGVVLRAVGFPSSREMGAAGRAPSCPVGPSGGYAEIATYGRREVRERPRESGTDEELMQRLRSLGYVD